MHEKFVGLEQACGILGKQGTEIAVVKNPEYVFPEFDLYPLAAKTRIPLERLAAVVMDMDGTTTTTETLCIHSLEYMVRQMTNRVSQQAWPGLDPVRDYPHIIGNSTTRHVEYLVTTYQGLTDLSALKQAYLNAALWFIFHGKDARRLQEVKSNLVNLGCGELGNDKMVLNVKMITPDLQKYVNRKYAERIDLTSEVAKVRAAIDIYYQRYHEILGAIRRGKGETLARQLLGQSDRHLIEPMPGIGAFLVLLKGWFGDQVENMLPVFLRSLEKRLPPASGKLETENLKRDLLHLSQVFARNPVKMAVVTSSIFYEAHIVLSEVFRVLQGEVENWPISPRLRKKIRSGFENYRTFYDACITATDSSEIRLKPHRDLYSMALHQLGIPKHDFNKVIGFEDSESGTIAIRAAGIGVCLAVPFSETSQHDFRAATHILHGGVTELVLKYNIFLSSER